MDNRYLSVVFKYKGEQLQAQVKLDEEGAVLDVFDVEGEVVATACKEYEDFGISKIKFNDYE